MEIEVHTQKSYSNSKLYPHFSCIYLQGQGISDICSSIKILKAQIVFNIIFGSLKTYTTTP